ncbi:MULTISPECIES: DUF5050 domain-containing protein [unclassified Flavobacterium]|uniref:DUF5050 domain-containing protein n=1 Tax=unclassified Flavobacterium TaxID=196869 RepID=UPI00131E73EB|nr:MULTISPECIES: DUF5050 domain-containing protein [unclassified Flavobacterium]
MSTDHNRIKVADLEKNQPNKILTTNTSGELEFSDINNTLDCTVPGKVLDARQGKVLQDNKVDKVTGKSLLSDTEITRLGTLSNYTHPVNHAPSIIIQDINNRFVTDAEKATWNAKQANITAGTSTQYYRGDKTWQTLNKTAVGLANTDNTADAAKNVFSATKLTTPRTINGTAFDGTANITIADSTKEPSIASGTTAQYLRGDKTWQALNKTAVGLANADNTADAAKNVLSATKLTTPRSINGTAFDGTANITINAVDSTPRIPVSEKGVANGVATLDSSGIILTTQLPSYVDDVLEFTNLAGFPATGETGKIYVANDTNKTYRWSGTAYIFITSGAVDSVAGKTGVVTLTKSDVGLANTDNTADAAKNVLSATKLTTPRSINGTAFDGTANITIADSTKEPSIATGTTAQYLRGDKTWQALDKTAVGLANVDNTSDLNKPVSTATQAAFNLKANLVSPNLTGVPTAPTATVGTNTTQIATTAFVLANTSMPDASSTIKGKVKLAGDLGGTADLPTVPGLATKANLVSPVLTGTPTAPTATAGTNTTQIATTAFVLANATTIPTGTISQYYRGDKSWQTLDKTAIGLNLVDNTSDANKPISTATQTAINGKLNKTGPDTFSGQLTVNSLVANDSGLKLDKLFNSSGLQSSSLGYYAKESSSIYSMVTDSQGNVYVGLRNGDIKKVTAQNVSSVFGTNASFGQSAARMIIDANGNIYVSNSLGRTITKTTPDGVTSLIATLPIQIIASYMGIAANGDIYYTSGNHQANENQEYSVGSPNLFKLTQAGVISVVATFPSVPTVPIVTSTCVFLNKNNYNSPDIYKVEFDGSYSTFVPGVNIVGAVFGMIDPAGNYLYYSNMLNNYIYKINIQTAQVSIINIGHKSFAPGCVDENGIAYFSQYNSTGATTVDQNGIVSSIYGGGNANPFIVSGKNKNIFLVTDIGVNKVVTPTAPEKKVLKVDYVGKVVKTAYLEDIPYVKADANGNPITNNVSINAKSYNLSALNIPPSSRTDTGTPGEIRITSSAIYVCIATNTWLRSVLSTW